MRQVSQVGDNRLFKGIDGDIPISIALAAMRRASTHPSNGEIREAAFDDEARHLDVSDLLHAAKLILFRDGDRDEDNKSALSVEESVSVAILCKRMAIRLGWDEVTETVRAIKSSPAPSNGVVTEAMMKAGSEKVWEFSPDYASLHDSAGKIEGSGEYAAKQVFIAMSQAALSPEQKT